MSTNHSFKPKGYNSLSPYLIIEGVEKMIEMLQHIFGATELRRFSRPDGSMMHVELKLDDSVIMLSEATEEYPANNFLLHMYVPDIYETFERAIKYGCKSLEEPVNKDDEQDTRGMFEDFAGNVWAVGMQEK